MYETLDSSSMTQTSQDTIKISGIDNLNSISMQLPSITKTKGFRSKNGCDYLQAVFLGDYVQTYRHDATQEPVPPMLHHHTYEAFWDMIEKDGWTE
jgi:hypothetical protein